jgi:hypothetical protein
MQYVSLSLYSSSLPRPHFVHRLTLFPLEFYPLGSCNAGDACKFSHNLETSQDRQPCKYFQKGNCKFGAKCALLHIIDGRLVNDPITQQLTIGPASGFQRQPPLAGVPQISGLSMGMQRLGPNQAPPPPTTNSQPSTNGYGYFGVPTSPTTSDGNHFQLSSQQNTPPSPPTYRSGLSSALRGQDIDGFDLPKSTPNSFNLLGPLDAPFPASVDLSNNQISRHGPFAASVPAKFGILSNSASVSVSMRDRGGEYYPSSGAQTPNERALEFGSRYGSPIDATPWNQEGFRSGNPLSSIQAARNYVPPSPHHSRPQSSSSPLATFDTQKQNPVQPASRVSQLSLQRARPAAISSSVPATHFGEKPLFSPVLIEDDVHFDTDALPSSLHDEVLLPQELNRRSSTTHTPGLNRRSSAYDEYARSPPSGAATPGSERGSLAGSPGSSRMEPLWSKLTEREPSSTDLNADLSTLSLTSGRQRLSSPLRNTVEPTYFRTQSSSQLPLKTPSVHAAQKWGGRTAEKLFPTQTNGTIVSTKEESHPVNVPGIVWRRTGEVVGTGRGELTKEEVMRIKEEEEGLEFSMDS